MRPQRDRKRKANDVNKRNQYVVRNGAGWGVRGEGNTRLTAKFETQGAAIERGRELAKKAHSELRIQGADTKFRAAWSYGSDPFPPKG